MYDIYMYKKLTAYECFRFLEDLDEGIYIQQTLESVLLNDDGKQLMVLLHVQNEFPGCTSLACRAKYMCVCRIACTTSTQNCILSHNF